MKTPLNMAPSPLRRQVVNTFLRARKVPPGRYRDDLRQLAFALLKLHRRGVRANVQVIDRTPQPATQSTDPTLSIIAEQARL
jgi:hypothetical protein